MLDSREVAAEQSAAGDAGPSLLSPTTGLRAGPAPLTLVSLGGSEIDLGRVHRGCAQLHRTRLDDS
jgi:hypothetical protein